MKECEPMVCLSPTGGVACPVDKCNRRGVTGEPYAMERHNLKQFTHGIDDPNGELWPMVQELKRIDDRLRGFGIQVMLTSNDDKEMGLLPLSLEFFLTLKDE